MKIEVIGYNEKEKAILQFERMDSVYTLSLNSKIISEGKVDDLKVLIKEYNDNYSNGINYIYRDFSKMFGESIHKLNESNVIRAFAVSDGYVHYCENFGNINILYNSIIDTYKTYLTHSSLIDWTGDLGTQPVMYFIKHEKIYDHQEKIQELFKYGLLYKYSITIPNQEEMISYFIPFELPDINNVKILPQMFLWNSLLKDMSDELQKLNRNK